MKVIAIHNVASPHVMPFYEEVVSILGEHNFRFATLCRNIPWRSKMGWAEYGESKWLLRPFESERDARETLLWSSEADILITAERDLRIFEERISKGLLTFFVSERWWKPPLGRARLFSPSFMAMAFKLRHLSQSSFLHYLAIGANAANDIRKIAAFPGRIWLWGYFTQPVSQGRSAPPEDRPVSILFAGRLIAWKRVDLLLRSFSDLSMDRPINLQIVGDGPEKARLHRMATALNIRERVSFRGNLPMELVWREMERADVFVLPSDGAEGWGAVANEAMGYECAMVASDQAGASRCLIKHGYNGMLFRSGDTASLAGALRLLVDEPRLRLAVARAGRETVKGLWSPRKAAERFTVVAEKLLSGDCVPVFSDGPLSRV